MIINHSVFTSHAIFSYEIIHHHCPMVHIASQRAQHFPDRCQLREQSTRGGSTGFRGSVSEHWMSSYNSFMAVVSMYIIHIVTY